MKTVYIAGKLNADAVGYLKNVSLMMDHANKVREMGFSVFVPALDLLMGLKFGDYSYADYFENNAEWLRRSDFIYVCPGWESSDGTKKEIRIAEEKGIPIYFSLTDLRNDLGDIIRERLTR